MSDTSLTSPFVVRLALLTSNATSTLVTAVHHYMLQKVTDSESKTYQPCVDRLLLSLLFHCSKDENHLRAMQDVEAALTSEFFLVLIAPIWPHNIRIGIINAEIELPKVPATACLTVRVCSSCGSQHTM